MGYDVELFAGWERESIGLIQLPDAPRRGVDLLATAHCSAFTPDRQRRSYRTDFLDALIYYEDGVAMIGDPDIPKDEPDGPLGLWTPDWTHSVRVLSKLRAAAEKANDLYTLQHLPRWEALVRLGIGHPGAVVAMTY